MPNACQVVITRGKNKGKRCSHVNRKCRHRNIVCSHCGSRFTMDTSFSRHLAGSKCAEADAEAEVDVEKMYERRIKVAVRHQTTPHTGDGLGSGGSSGSIPGASILMEKIQKLEQELETVKNKTTTVHHWIVMGGNFYDDLVTKMGGRDHAVNYLASVASEGKPIDIISKLYLEGKSPENYPIACRDEDHFRYMDSDHQLVDDIGGHSIKKVVTSGIHDALVLSKNILI